MERRSFFKAMAGAVCSGFAAVMVRVRDKLPTPFDFWDDSAEDVYDKTDGETINYGTYTAENVTNVSATMLDGVIYPKGWKISGVR